MITDFDMLRLSYCCSCSGDMQSWTKLNFVALGMRAKWHYPTTAYWDTINKSRTFDEALAMICDQCLADGFTITRAIEVREGLVIYHGIETLELLNRWD